MVGRILLVNGVSDLLLANATDHALLSGGAAGSSFLAAWARGSNLSVIGTGNY